MFNLKFRKYQFLFNTSTSQPAIQSAAAQSSLSKRTEMSSMSANCSCWTPWFAGACSHLALAKRKSYSAKFWLLLFAFLGSYKN